MKTIPLGVKQEAVLQQEACLLDKHQQQPQPPLEDCLVVAAALVASLLLDSLRLVLVQQVGTVLQYFSHFFS